MNTILDRIQQIADNESITLGAMEKKIGASKGVLSRAKAQNTDIQAKWIEKIVENYPLINANWLLTGVGEMYRNGEKNVAYNTESTSNIKSLIEILNRTLIEKDKQIDRLLSIIEQGKV